MLKNCFKAVSGGFFRTIGKMLAYFLIISIIVYFGFMKSSKAEIVPLYGDNTMFAVEFNGTSNFPYTIGVGANSTITFPITLYNYEGFTRPYTYLIMSVCANGPTSKFNISNASYNNSYFVDGSVSGYSAGECSLAWKSYMQFPIGKYQDYDGTGEELKVSSNLSITNYWSWGVQYQITGFYLSSDDLITALQKDEQLAEKFTSLDTTMSNGFTSVNDKIQSSINEVNKGFSNMSSMQQQTNNKLDNVNKTQQQTNNKLDSVNQTQQQTNQKLDQVNDSITSEEPPDLSGLENSAGWLPAGPVDSILNLPLSLLNNITTNLSKSCQPVNLDLPFVKTKLTLPCINSFYDSIGIKTWVTTIGVIASAFILFSYFLKLYKWVDDTLSMRENTMSDWGGA